MSPPPFFGVKGCANNKVDTPRSGSDLGDLSPGREVQSSSCHSTAGKFLFVNETNFKIWRRTRYCLPVSGLGSL